MPSINPLLAGLSEQDIMRIESHITTRDYELQELADMANQGYGNAYDPRDMVGWTPLPSGGKKRSVQPGGD